MKKTFLSIGVFLLAGAASWSATVPYTETFDSYATGDTPTTDFNEFPTTDWTIVSSFSGNAYQNVVSATAPGTSTAAGSSASAAVEFPTLASSNFTISTRFRIDSLTTTSVNPEGNAFVGLVARSANGFQSQE